MKVDFPFETTRASARLSASSSSVQIFSASVMDGWPTDDDDAEFSQNVIKGAVSLDDDHHLQNNSSRKGHCELENRDRPKTCSCDTREHTRHRSLCMACEPVTS